MDDGPRARVLSFALLVGLLVLGGAGCSSLSRSTVPPATTSTPVVAETTANFPLAWKSFRRACDLTREDLARLIEPEPDGQGMLPLNTVINQKQEDGWLLKQLCLDRDVWVVGERDAIYTVYFSMAKNVGPEEDQAIIGSWTLQLSLKQKTGSDLEPVRLSDPVSFQPEDYGNPVGFNMLDLEKHYLEEGRIIPTVLGRTERRAIGGSHRMTYAFGPDDARLRKVYDCKRIYTSKDGNPETATLTSDTCKNNLD